ncbi:flagellar basal body rod protein FlgC [Planctomicrobium sp. SH664]|uniref:flagellar basal body rod protein FlgC n=1 Tax=Planctomicrobium sp. SH664 TaxID=3448125 RepID=UPI003F5C87A0
MGLDSLFSATSIAGSGLTAERTRMEVAANNIANANSTRTAAGGPYRRQQVVFSSLMDDSITRSGGNIKQGLTGVQVSEITTDQSALPRVHNPGHPDAGPDGFVEMPNVMLPHEMIDLMTASRAYEANLKSLQIFRQMAEQSLNLMRGMS